MKTIFKFELSVTTWQWVKLPRTAAPLTVQLQHGKPMLWALCESDEVTSERVIYLIGTGNTMPNTNVEYIGTVQLHEGTLVLHAFIEQLPSLPAD